MGTDIHICFEAKRNGRWIQVDDDSDDDLSNRSYTLFSILSGVRSKSPLGITLATEGIPNDLSDEIRQHIDQWGGDGHTHSYMTLADLKAAPWNEECVPCEGFVSLFHFLNKEDGLFYSSHGSITYFPDAEEVDREKFDSLLKAIPLDNNERAGKIFCKMKWNETLTGMVNGWDKRVIKLMSRYGSDNDVRMVFWYDN